MRADKGCTFHQCDRKHHGHGWCRAHLDQVRGGKRPTPIRPRGDSIEDKFWRYTAQSGRCWEWTSVKNPNGYGRIHHFNRLYLAHRVGYEIHFGPIPEGMVIDHMCHNAGCVNPYHLRAVTQTWNMQNQIKPPSSNTSGVRGVYWNKEKEMWTAAASVSNKSTTVGHFEDLEEAARVLHEWRIENQPGFLLAVQEQERKELANDG